MGRVAFDKGYFKPLLQFTALYHSPVASPSTLVSISLANIITDDRLLFLIGKMMKWMLLPMLKKQAKEWHYIPISHARRIF